MAAATDTLSDPVSPTIGIRAPTVQRLSTGSEIPFPSDPITMAVAFLRFSSYIESSAFSLAATIWNSESRK